MRIAVTGSSGLVGTALLARLVSDGHETVRLLRTVVGGDAVGGDGVAQWDPEVGTIDASALEGLDAVVHLAGAGIGDARWTPERKQLIAESRTRSTDLLSRTLAGLIAKPAVFVSGSAIGWYGGRGDEILVEESAPPPEPDFLARLCHDWEVATAPAEEAGIRTVHLRTGIVIGAGGGVLSRMLTPFRLGLGGRIGDGRQYMSWISIADEVGAILHAIKVPELAGPVNLTGPAPVTNTEFTKTLGRLLHRPTFLPTPLFGLRALYGAELVQHLLVEGQRVSPAKLTASGYSFECETIESALTGALR